MEIMINGENIPVTEPNLAIALDIISLWGDGPTRAHMGRLCACAMGVCVPSLQLPAYSMIHADPIAYGGKALERLLSRGISAGNVYSEGMKIIVWMAGLLPHEKEVEAAKDFLSEKGAAN